MLRKLIKAAAIVVPTLILMSNDHAEALGFISPLLWINHIRFACSLTNTSHEDNFTENEFCHLARSSLEDLAAGKIDSAVLKTTPYWDAIFDPQAAIDKCRAQSTQPGGGIPAGACERDEFELMYKDQPLPLVAIDLADAVNEDQSSLTIIVKGTVDSETAPLDITVEIIEPSMISPPTPQHRIEMKRSVRVENMADKEKTLHESFQGVWTSYFGPFAMNAIRAHAIIKAKQDSERRGLP